MSVGKISELVDDKVFDELDKIIQKLGITTQNFVQATEAGIGFTNAISNVRSINEFNAANQQAATSLQSVKEAEAQVIAVEQQANAVKQQAIESVKAKAVAEADAAKILTQLGGSIEANIKLLVQQRIELGEVTEQLKNHTKNMGDNISSQAKNVETTAALTKQQLLLKEAIAQNTLTIKQQTKEQLAAESSNNMELAQLNQLIKLQNTLTKEEREQTVQGQQLQASIDRLRASTKEANEAQGKFNDNVGNYPGKAGAATEATEKASKSLNVMGRLSNVLTSRLFRLAGSFLIMTVAFGAIEFIYKWAAGLDIFTGRLNQALQNFNAWNEAMKDAQADSGKQIGSLKILYDATQDVTLSMKDRLAAANELQKLYPDQFSASKTQALLNGEEKKSYEELTQAIIENARADAAKVKIQQLEGQIIDEEFKQQKIRNALSNQLARVKAPIKSENLGSAESGGGVFQDDISIESQKKGLTEVANIALQKSEEQKKVYQGQVDFLEKTVGLKKLAESVENDDKSKDKKGPKDRSWEIDVANAKAKLEYMKALAKERLDNDKRSYDARLSDLADYIEKSNALIDLERDAKNRKPGITQKERDTNNTEAETQRLGVTAFNKSEQDRLAKERNDALRKNLEDYLKYQKDAADQAIQISQQLSEDQLTILDLEKNREETLIANKYAKGIIDEKEYRKELLRIADQYNIDRLGQIAFQEQTKLEILQAKENADVSTAQGLGASQGQINDIKAKSGVAQQRNVVSKAGINLQDAINKKTQDDAKNNNGDSLEVDTATKIGYLQQLQDDASKMLQANLENEISLLEKRKQLIEETANAEINTVQNSIASSKEKAREEAIIREQAKQQQIQVDAQITKIKQRQAEYDRALSIANIIENTAIGISKATGTVFGLPLVPVIAALGAAQLATVLATPLPRFERGTKNSPEGYATVSERGPELLIDPSGNISLTPSKESIMYLQKGSQIIPNDELMRIVGRPEPVYHANDTRTDNRKVEKLLEENNKLQREKDKIIIINNNGDRWSQHSKRRNY